MKVFIRILPIVLCCLLMAAHLSRAGIAILALVSLLIPFLLIWKSRITAIFTQIILVVFSAEWVRTLIFYAQIRMEYGQDWIRLALILGTVSLLNLATILVFRSKVMKKLYKI